MESQYKHPQNGESVLKADLELIGETSGLADDRVLGELFRLQPFDGSIVRKAILPYAHKASGSTPMLAPNGATGSILVSPFRAIVGTRTLSSVDAKKNWRDIRSAIAVGATALTQQVSFSANASGNPRWDLVYAVVAVDTNATGVVRKVKDPVSKAITGVTVFNSIVTTATLAVIAGTPSATPTFPALPSDAAGNYYIPLGYVRIPNGFGATSTVMSTDFALQSPLAVMSRATGGVSIQPADQQYIISTAQQQTWGASGAAADRPYGYMPPTMAGGEAVLIKIPAGVADGTVLDSRDWRGRLCQWHAAVSSGGLNAANDFYPPFSTFGVGTMTFAGGNDSPNTRYAVGLAQTESLTETAPYNSNNWACIVQINGNQWAVVDDAVTMAVYCDLADGKLKLRVSGGTASAFFFWLTFSAPFENIR